MRGQPRALPDIKLTHTLNDPPSVTSTMGSRLTTPSAHSQTHNDLMRAHTALCTPRNNSRSSSSIRTVVVEDNGFIVACGGLPAEIMATVKSWSPSNSSSLMIGMGAQSA